MEAKQLKRKGSLREDLNFSSQLGRKFLLRSAKNNDYLYIVDINTEEYIFTISKSLSSYWGEFERGNVIFKIKIKNNRLKIKHFNGDDCYNIENIIALSELLKIVLSGYKDRFTTLLINNHNELFQKQSMHIGSFKSDFSVGSFLDYKYND